MSTEKYLNRQRTTFYYMLNFKCDVFNGVTCHASRDSQLIRGLERHSLVIQSEANTADYPLNIFYVIHYLYNPIMQYGSGFFTLKQYKLISINSQKILLCGIVQVVKFC